jgi:hypothetical protein
VKGTIDNIEKVRSVYAFEIFRRVVERTPVDKGAARQNWLVTLNNEDTAFDLDKKKGGMVLSDGGKVIDSAKGDDTIIVQNSVPYIAKLEYGGYGDGPKTVNGFSRQAPNGMVGVTMAQAGQIFQAAVNAVKGGGA